MYWRDSWKHIFLQRQVGCWHMLDRMLKILRMSHRVNRKLHIIELNPGKRSWVWQPTNAGYIVLGRDGGTRRAATNTGTVRKEGPR